MLPVMVGMVSDVMVINGQDDNPLKALVPMDVQELRSTLVRLLQPLNALPPMDVQELRSTLVRLLQP